MVPLWCRVSIQSQRYNFSTNYKLSPEHWDQQRQAVSKKCKDYRGIMESIDQIRTEVRMWYNRLVDEGETPSCERFKEDRKAPQEDYHSLSSLFKYHAALEGANLAPSTMKLYRNTQRHVMAFIAIKYHVSDIDIRKIKKDFVPEFVAYLKGWKRENAKMLCTQNGAMKNVIRLVRLFNVALDNDWIDSNPIARYKKKMKHTELGYLTREEMACLEELQELSVTEQHVRDCFLFSCWTGLCWADAERLTTSNITVGIDGRAWLNYKRLKTDIAAMVPILEPALKILFKYKQFQEVNMKGKALPLPCNQICNRVLKGLAMKAGIDKKVTYHMARHTFATTVTLLNGVPIETVSAMLGHQKISTTQIYAKVTGQKIIKDTSILRTMYEEVKPEEKKVINQ